MKAPSARRTAHPRGFTLIELMIVVAIMSVLALIAIPKFAQLIEKSREAGTVGHMGHIRSALLLYYMENEQVYPDNFAGMLQSDRKYINDIAIPLHTGDHIDSYVVDDIPDTDSIGDTGNWSYVSGGENRGFFYVQCIHQDMKGQVWSQL